MAEVEIYVGGHKYRVGCEAGQEQAVEALGDMIDTEILNMREQAGNLGEARQLLYASLTLADRLKDTERKMAAAAQTADTAGSEDEMIERLAERIEKLAETLEKHTDGH